MMTPEISGGVSSERQPSKTKFPAKTAFKPRSAILPTE
jgi:hypothetical protein